MVKFENHALFIYFFCYLSHENLEYFGECKDDTTDEETETDLCLNETSSIIKGAEIFKTKSGWPSCQGTLTFIKSNGEKKYIICPRKNFHLILV